MITQQIKFSGTGINGTVSALTLDILPGSLQLIDDDDIRGGTDGLPVVLAGIGDNGKCDVLLDSTAPTLATLMGLISPCGEGDFTVTDVTDSNKVISRLALVDVNPKGDAVQIFTVSWKGTNYTP
jgi:hypothetical protein